MKRLVRVLLPAIVLAPLCGGCAAMQRQKVQQMESMLSASGFKMKIADTPEKVATVKAKPQLKLQPLSRHGKLYYAYADADGCGCTYIGDQAAYQSYQGLVQQKEIAREDKEAAAVNEDAAIVEDDGMWESWGGDVW
jgi:hypothetical protein